MYIKKSGNKRMEGQKEEGRDNFNNMFYIKIMTKVKYHCLIHIILYLKLTTPKGAILFNKTVQTDQLMEAWD